MPNNLINAVTGIFLYFFLPFAFADAGSCTIYHVNIILEDGEEEGYLLMRGQNDYAYLNEVSHSNQYCSDQGIMKLLNEYVNLRNQRNQEKEGVITLYRNIYFPQFLQIPNLEMDNQVAMVAENDVVYINLSDISGAKFIKADVAGFACLTTNMVIADEKWVKKAGLKDHVSHGWLFYTEDNLERYCLFNFSEDISPEKFHAKLNEVQSRIKVCWEEIEEGKRRDRDIYQDIRKFIEDLKKEWEPKGVIFVYNWDLT